MKDALGREIEYLRVSVTDRCNLRCRYCMPRELPRVPPDQILRYEEIERVCRSAATVGIRAVRVTGGEPLLRRDCADLLQQLKRVPGLEQVTLTTNGVLLEPLVGRLASIGVDGVNISLDTLDPAVYRRLTGENRLDQVLRGLRAAVAAGLHVKVNCVPMEEVNATELGEIATLARRYPLDVRFIELMPTRAGQSFTPVSGAEVLRRLHTAYPDLAPTGERRGFGPARYYGSKLLRGRIGLIEAVNNHFCEACNRVRLTSEGFLKLCLYHDNGTDLRELLRRGTDDRALTGVISDALAHKPARHHFGCGRGELNGGIDDMSRIGG